MAYSPVSRVSIDWKTDWESTCFKGPSNLSDETIPSRVIHSLAVNVNFPECWRIELEADNLTDDQAPDRWGYPKPGRGFYLTISYRFTGISAASGNSSPSRGS
jgi:outer membrane receptor protein involved in Fe transport